MSAGCSIDLSEFLNDDDSVGHRFVDFIKRRRGDILKQQFLFDCEAVRLSLDVQLEKLPTPQLKNVHKMVSPQNKTICAPTEKQTGADEATAEYLDLSNAAHQQYLSLKTARASEQRNDATSTTTSAKSNKSVIRKSNDVISTSNRLKRISPRNISSKKFTTGRRTQLQECESTSEGANFSPSIYSTPISQPTQNVPQLLNTNPISEVDKCSKNGNNAVSRGSCYAYNDTLIKTLQSKDHEQKNCMGNILSKPCKHIENQSIIAQNDSADNTIVNRTRNNSPSKRTFTVEKGGIAGQVILTPDKNCNQDTSNSNIQKNKRTKRNLSAKQHRLNCKSSNRRSVHQSANVCSLSIKEASKKNRASYSRKEAQKEAGFQEIKNGNNEIAKNSCDNNLFIILPNKSIEIHDAGTKTNIICKTDCSGKEQQVVANPNNQSVNEVTCQEKYNYNVNNNEPEVNTSPSPVRSQILQQAGDNLKLADILTDDEDNSPILSSQNIQNQSKSPLNLAPRSYDLRKKHKYLKNNFQQQSVEIEVKIPPPAHSNKQVHSRKCKPLIKPPGTPLNGEKYAMSNYEILDLRKRNSTGQIFVANGRRSRRSLKEVDEKKNLLDYQIKQELLNRNLVNISQHEVCQLDQENVEGNCMPAPYNLRDSVTAPEENQIVLEDMNLIDDTSSDQVNFKSNENKRKTRKQRSLSKRSLKSNSCSKSKKLEITPPKKHQCLVTTPKVLSPPPAVTTSGMVADSTVTGEILNNPKDIHMVADENVSLPPPPTAFESDSVISTNNNYKNDTQQYTTNVTVEVGTTNDRIKTNPNVNNDRHLFKNPTNPAPNRKCTKRALKIIAEESTTAGSQISIDSSADRADGGSLRRSKRGQVPRCRPPILDILYQQELKRMECSEMKRKMKLKKQKQEAEKKRRMLKTINNKNTEANSPSIVAKSVNAESDCKSLKRKGKQSTQSQQKCLILSSLPPVEQLNNIFDQLKQTSLIPKAAVECSQTTPQYKIKPFQVRVRRLKLYDATPSMISRPSVSSTSTNTTSNGSVEWVSWLKNMSQACSDHPQASEAFRQMRISSATNLQFSELQGVEYAFYDTAEKASLGYLRFKPLQVKPKKKAKLSDLHFINMMGNFRINVNGCDSFLSVGDMVAIEKSAYYDVQNLSDDVSILMVIKR